MISRAPYLTSLNLTYSELMALPVSRRDKILSILKETRDKEAAAWAKAKK